MVGLSITFSTKWSGTALSVLGVTHDVYPPNEANVYMANTRANRKGRL